MLYLLKLYLKLLHHLILESYLILFNKKSLFISFILYENKTSPNIGILLNFVLPILLKNPFASYSFKNLDFLLLHIVHSDNSIVLPLLVFKTLGFMFPVFFFRTLNNKMALLYI